MVKENRIRKRLEQKLDEKEHVGMGRRSCREGVGDARENDSGIYGPEEGP